VSLVFDTGPLFASSNVSDVNHRVSRKLIEESDEDFVIPAPVLVELDYWINERLYPAVFLGLLDDIADGIYRIEDLTPDDYRRVRSLCERYADSNIGFVDASVVAIAERLNEDKIATLDHRHFSIIRPRHVRAFRLLPA
jgi:predicted nucleic acid-binding protein